MSAPISEANITEKQATSAYAERCCAGGDPRDCDGTCMEPRTSEATMPRDASGEVIGEGW